MTTTEPTSFTAYPPDFIGPIIGYRCNTSEWVASILSKGDRCWFRKRIGRNYDSSAPLGEWRPATFMSAMFYDGVIVKVYEDDPDDLITHSLFLDLGEELRAEAP